MSETVEHGVIVVGIAAYNEERHIAETIASLKAQQWQDFAVLISDNASTDATREVCLKAIGEDGRFHYLRHAENQGAAWNFTYLIDHSRSPFFMALGAHDKVPPDFLAVHLKKLREQPEFSLSYSRTQWIDETGRPLKLTDPSELGAITGTPIRRYFRSVRQIHECTGINNVLRRDAIGPTRTEHIARSDKVMLSELLFHGPAHLAEGPLYFRRTVGGRPDYMERMTGKPGQSPDLRATVSLYLAGFDRLPIPWLKRRLTRVLLGSLLRKLLLKRYGLRDRFYFRIIRWLDL